MSETNFRFANQKTLFTYSGHIAKDLIRDLFDCFDAKLVEIAHETGATGYLHTHVYVDFGKRYETRNSRHFDIEGVHPNIKKVLTKEHFENIMAYLAKEDPENAHLLKPKCLFDVISQMDNIHDAMRLVRSPGEAVGIRTMFEARGRQEYVNTVTLREGFQTNLRDELLQRDDNRHLIWFIDRAGATGKSVFCQYMEDEYNCLLITQMGGSRDVATVVKNAIELDGWNNGIILIDLPRKAETKSIYEPIEMLLNGRMTAVKYSGARLRWHTKTVCVFANFPPAVDELSLDRWDIRELMRDSKGNLNIKDRFPLDFKLSLP